MSLSILLLTAAMQAAPSAGTPAPVGDEYEDFIRKSQSEYAKFRKDSEERYATFRDSVNAAYEDFMRQPWKPIKFQPPKPKPRIVEPKPEPVVIREDEMKRRRERLVSIDTVVAPEPRPAPEPPSPVTPEPRPRRDVKKHKLVYYGTPLEVSVPDLTGFHLAGASENSFADGWKRLRTVPAFDNMLADCLAARRSLQLPDWGFIVLLDRATDVIAPSGSNEHALVMGYLLHQSGFKIRYAIDSSSCLHLLIASVGIMYDRPGYSFDGLTYYAYTRPSSNVARICDFDYPGSKTMRLTIDKAPQFVYAAGETRRMTAYGFPDLSVTLTVNKNLCDFFADYPNASPDRSPYSKWAIHGNTPASREVTDQLYPTLRQSVKGKNQIQAVNMLLKLAQTFPYGYDDQIWGHDRAFWMDESWQYPLSDCEDHAINFTRMVRDILGLDAVLIYYPGHLSAAVAFTEGQPGGDFVVYDGRRYTVCDATCQYGPIGYSGKFDNSQAILIPLSR